MRLLTFNLWHGLSPTSLVAFEALEPTARRKLREELQIQVVRELKPDICFFQEVCPITSRARQFSTELNMSDCVQPDLVGLKLFGFGFPLNLNSGLCTLVAHRFGAKWVRSLSLSRPGMNLVHTWASWQLKEERFALFAETLIPRWGRVLLVNTHLHHGLECTESLLEQLDKLGDDLDLSPALIHELKDRLLKGNQRRRQEIDILLDAINEMQSRYEAVILGGDFNASPESELYKTLRQAGFRDAWSEVHGDGVVDGLSFDHTRNVANHLLQGRFPLTLVVEDLSFEPQMKEALLSLARRQEMRPRRIDYLWIRSSSVPFKFHRAELAGLPNSEGLAPSDHFGVYADIEA